MKEEREISREKAIEEEIIKEKLEKAKKTGEIQEIKTEIPAGTLVEQVRFKKFKKVEEGFQKMFVAEDITLTKGEKAISFREMTPKSIRYFVRDKYNFSEKDDDFAIEKVSDKEDAGKVRMKIIIYGDLSKTGNPLSLLHEVGHSHADPRLELDLGNAKARVNQAYLEVETKAETQRKPKRLKPMKDETLWRNTRESEFRPVKKTLVDRFIELQSQEERNAWAYALRSLHKFRKEGLDLEPQMKRLEDVEKFIYGKIGLGGYVIDIIERTGASRIKEEILPIIKRYTK